MGDNRTCGGGQWLATFATNCGQICTWDVFSFQGFPVHKAISSWKSQHSAVRFPALAATDWHGDVTAVLLRFPSNCPISTGSSEPRVLERTAHYPSNEGTRTKAEGRNSDFFKSTTSFHLQKLRGVERQTEGLVNLWFGRIKGVLTPVNNTDWGLLGAG
jgi:hypothetical protein